MDIHEIRRRNLDRLIEEDFAGNRAELSRKMEKNNTILGRFFIEGEHARNIGGAVAREIEEAAGRPSGWMDMEHLDPDLLGAVIEEVDTLIDSQDFEADGKARARLYIAAYEASKERGKVQLKQARAILISLTRGKR